MHFSRQCRLQLRLFRSDIEATHRYKECSTSLLDNHSKFSNQTDQESYIVLKLSKPLNQNNFLVPHYQDVVTCRVKIANKSGSSKHYLLFMDAPKPTNGPSGKVFFNVYDRSPKIESDNNAFVRWDCTSDFYALYGTAQTTPDGNSKVETGASRPVKWVQMVPLLA